MFYSRFLRLVLAIICVQVSSLANAHEFRIVGGRNATPSEFPYLVEIDKYTQYHCGGSIIKPYYILTAAHCVKPYDKISPVPKKILRVRLLGEPASNAFEIKNITVHENYKHHAPIDQYDIALIRISNSVENYKNAKPIALTSKVPNDGTLAWVAGYGRQEIMKRSVSNHRHLMAVELPIISTKKCQAIMDYVADDMICAGFLDKHADACVGDSGGPLVAEEQLVGIVAWGIGCGRLATPGVYTNVALYRDWIDNVTEKNN